MIGKFIAPAGAGTPSPKGIYISGQNQSIAPVAGTKYFHNVGILNSDLTEDTSFNIGSNGGFLTPAGNGTTFSTAVNIIGGEQQADGKIVLIGSFTRFEGVDSGFIVRLNLDGTIDTLFNSGGSGFASGFLGAIKIQSDQKIIVAGSFVTYNGSATPNNRFIRLNPNGSIDTSFTAGTGPNNAVNSIEIQSDGKILIGGDFTSYNGVAINRMARLNSDGTLDTSFNIGTGFNGGVTDIKISTLGIYVGGTFTNFNGATGTVINAFIRLNSNGTRDTAFNKDYSTSVSSICVLPDNSVIVGGTFSNERSGRLLEGLSRYNSNGTVFTNFQSVGNQVAGSGSNGPRKVIYIASDNTLLVCGPFEKFGYKYPSRYFVKINIDGSDIANPPAFGFINFSYGIQTPTINSILELSNGKILLVGSFLISSTSNFNTNPNDIYNIVKIQESNSFSTLNTKGQRFSQTQTYGLYLDDLNDIYLLGDIAYSTEGSLDYRRIIKFDNQGNLLYEDPINLNNVTDDNIAYVSSLAKLSDGKFLIVGQFRVSFGLNIRAFVKVDQDGVVDTSFVAISPSSPGITSFSTQTVIKESSNGKIYIGGAFEALFVGGGSSFRRGLIRVNADGTIDTTFLLGTSLSNFSGGSAVTVVDLVIQPDGKIIIIGAFDSYVSTSRRYILRLNVDGTLDTTFSVGTGFFTTAANASIDRLSTRKLILQSDGKVVVCGRFVSYNGFTSRGIIRLNSDGSRDTTFNVGTGFDLKVDDIYMTSDGRIHAVGDFRSYNGNSAVGYCVLNSDGSFHSAPYRFTLPNNYLTIKE